MDLDKNNLEKDNLDKNYLEKDNLDKNNLGIANMDKKNLEELNNSVASKDEDTKELEWIELETEHIIQDQWIDFRKSKYKLPNGNVFDSFYTYSRRDYVVIVATDEDGNYICVRQFRQGIKAVTTEFPAGGIERTDGKNYAGENRYIDETGKFENNRDKDELNNYAGETRGREDICSSEDPLETAKRELKEETGYVSDDWQHLLTIPSNATISDNYAYIFKAENCKKVSGQSLDITESLNIKLHTADEIEKLIRGGRFQQSVHVLAWLLAKL